VLTDTHCHLYADAFGDDLQAVLQRAASVGVTRIYLPNVDQATLEPMRSLVEGYQGPIQLRTMLGLHPCSVEETWKEEWEVIEALLRATHPSSKRPVAVGEIGLDLYWRQDNLALQMAAMMAQIQTAIQLNLPVCFHSRNSMEQLLDCTAGLDFRAVYHCFSGTKEQAATILQRGQYLGVGGTLTFGSNRALRDVIAGVDRTRVILETDAPYLAPVPHRGQRNEPAHVSLVAKELGALWDMEIEEVAERTTQNALALFEPELAQTTKNAHA